MSSIINRKLKTVGSMGISNYDYGAIGSEFYQEQTIYNLLSNATYKIMNNISSNFGINLISGKGAVDFNQYNFSISFKMLLLDKINIKFTSEYQIKKSKSDQGHNNYISSMAISYNL